MKFAFKKCNVFVFLISHPCREDASDFVNFNLKLCHVLALCHYPAYINPFDRINFHVTDIQSVTRIKKL